MAVENETPRARPGEKKFSKQLVKAAKILKNSHACWKKRSRRTRPREPTMDPKSSREDIAPPESFHEQINPAVADSDALLAAIPKSETRDLETSSSRSTEQKSATAAKLASVTHPQPLRLSSSRVSPCSLAKAEIVLSDTLTHPLRFTLTKPASQLWTKGRSPKSVTPLSPPRFKCTTLGQSRLKTAKLASPNPLQLRIDKDFRELQGGNAGTPNAKSFIPKQFSKARAFSFPAECTRIPKNPTWLIRWHSSNCRLSSETAALTKETTPLSDRKVHFRRQSCFTLGQPLPTASIPKSVTPGQAVITRDLNFFKPRPEPMTQKPLSFMF
nr:hypothetical protein TorRG33x02_227750 [Ipomoea batatas]